MKTKAVLYLLFVVLVTNGSSCVNDGFLVAVDFPVQTTFPINPGPNTNFTGTISVNIADQLGSAYKENVTKMRYYDIRVGVSGTYAGSVNGSCSVNGATLLVFSGLWSDFATPQSLLGSSSHVTPQTAGTNVLLNLLNSLDTNPNATLTLKSSGTVSQGPVPAGLAVIVTIYAQADSQVK